MGRAPRVDEPGDGLDPVVAAPAVRPPAAGRAREEVARVPEAVGAEERGGGCVARVGGDDELVQLGALGVGSGGWRVASKLGGGSAVRRERSGGGRVGDEDGLCTRARMQHGATSRCGFADEERCCV